MSDEFIGVVRPKLLMKWSQIPHRPEARKTGETFILQWHIATGGILTVDFGEGSFTERGIPQMFMKREPKSAHGIPGQLAMFGVTHRCNFQPVGIGGGTLSMLFMVWCNLTFNDAIGTSAAIGFSIAGAGSLRYIYYGLGVFLACRNFRWAKLISRRWLGSWLLSFDHAFGVGLAHTLPVGKLKRVFACS